MVQGWYKWRVEEKIDDLPVAMASNTFSVPYPTRGYFSVADANLMAGTQVKEFQLKLNRYFGGGKCTLDELFEDHYLMQEFLCRTIFPECSRWAGRDISKQVVIFDLSGISLSMLSHWPALNMLREMLANDQLYYPERMHKTFVINAPAMFVTAWNVIKGWLDPRVISKIQILGKNYSPALLKQVPPQNLPAFLGGTCRCSHMPGGCVPS
ncbi:CRAL/TRIO domain-containing protein, partial [Linderina pennispora]